ncbi:MAG: DUF6057 family protein [Bacteroides sp.]|nr:DUF6057 family protein [Bacteroides sp.]
MNIFLQKYGKAGLLFFFGIAFLLFWMIGYPSLLAYREQFQLFMFGSDYWWERVAVPGGVADYIGEFLTQFYYVPWIGACMLTFLFLSLQCLLWRLLKFWEVSDFYIPLTFLPVIVLWRYYTDENVMLSLVVALLMVLAVAILYSMCSNRWYRMAYVVMFLPFLYWVAGPVHFIFAGWIVLNTFRKGVRKEDIWSRLGVMCGIVLLAVACPLLACVELQYPLSCLVWGLNYHRLFTLTPWMGIVLAILLVLLPCILSVLPLPRKNRILYGGIQFLIVLAGGYMWVLAGYDVSKEDALEYDYLVRHEDWQSIIEKAEHKMPQSSFSMTYLNLALGMTGQLGDRMFEFRQRGMEGLIPQFRSDPATPMRAGEVFYRLGMINTAQRFAFEAMEANLNYRKSARCVKRLAETNLINGQYEVAAKYLRMLRRTVFYKEWAEYTMTYLHDEDKINAHPEWGWLRRARYTEDFLFSDQEMDMMLGLLFQHNYNNRLAFEYLMAYVMLRRDMDKFMAYYPIGRHAKYDHIPRHYQEALVYVWTQQHQDFKGMPWSISPEVKKGMADFARAYMSSRPGMRQSLKMRYGNTYWSYLLLDGEQ